MPNTKDPMGSVKELKLKTRGVGAEDAKNIRERMDMDFSDVKVHGKINTDPMGASAYAKGAEIYGGSKEDGKNLLAHELSHVVQQGQKKP